MLLKIVESGHPVLRRTSRALTKAELLSPEIQRLIELMRETMRDAPGVGLAAPQIGESIQLAVIEDREQYLTGFPPERLALLERRPVSFHVIANPVLTAENEELAEFYEGCLSVGRAGFTAIVPRAKNVRVDALDHRGEPITLRAGGWHARILQHEIDHLNGRLFLDRMYSRTFSASAEYGRHWAGRDIDEVKKELEL
jgi:peptide deformylase